MLLAERPADGRDEFIEAVVLDDRAWPKDLDEFVSRHDGAGVLDEIQESVERLRGNFDATPVEVRQRAMLRLQAKDAELVNDGMWKRLNHLRHPAAAGMNPSLHSNPDSRNTISLPANEFSPP